MKMLVLCLIPTAEGSENLFYPAEKSTLGRTRCRSWDPRQDPAFVRSLPWARTSRARSSGLHPDALNSDLGRTPPDALAMLSPAGLCTRGLTGRRHSHQTPSSDLWHLQRPCMSALQCRGNIKSLMNCREGQMGGNNAIIPQSFT